jgi:hypothetical protein
MPYNIINIHTSTTKRTEGIANDTTKIIARETLSGRTGGDSLRTTSCERGKAKAEANRYATSTVVPNP